MRRMIFVGLVVGFLSVQRSVIDASPPATQAVQQSVSAKMKYYQAVLDADKALPRAIQENSEVRQKTTLAADQQYIADIVALVAQLYVDGSPPATQTVQLPDNAKKKHDAAISEASKAMEEANEKCHKIRYNAIVLASQEYVADLDAALKAAKLASDAELTRALVEEKTYADAMLQKVQSGDVLEVVNNAFDNAAEEAWRKALPTHQRIMIVCQARGNMMSIFDAVRKESRKAVEKLKPPQSFQIIFFQGEHVYQVKSNEMLLATPENKHKALDLIEKIAPGGTTDPIPALDMAFKQNADNIVLMADGFDNDKDVLDEIHKLNPEKKVHISLITFMDEHETEEDVKLLRKIAEENGGTFRFASDVEVKIAHGTDLNANDVPLKAESNVNAKDKGGFTPLLYATVFNSKPDVIAALLKGGADVNAKTDSGCTPLMIAAAMDSNPDISAVPMFSNRDVIAALLKGGADVNAKTDNGCTPLMVAAAFNSNPGVISALLEAGSDVKAKDKDGATPLIYAAKNSIAVIEVLLKAGADVSTALDYARAVKNSPAAEDLFVAVCVTGTAQQVKAMIDRGADVNAKGEYDRLPLMYAVEFHSDPGVIASLLKAGADVNAKNKKGKTPLMYAVEFHSDPGVIAALLNASANVNVKDTNGMTSLLYAARDSSLAVNEMLLKASADVNAKDTNGKTPLMWAGFNSSSGVIAAILKAGADVNAKDTHGKTPLMYAVIHTSNLDAIAVFLKAGAYLNEKDKSGQTALDYARQMKNNSRMVETLIKAEEDTEKFLGVCKTGSLNQVKAMIDGGANSNAKDNDGLTPLMNAAYKNPNPDVITALLRIGADVNAKEKNGWTPLMFAAWNPNPPVTSALLKAGADVNAKSKDGWTPLMFAAADNPNPDVIAALLKGGADANAKNNAGKTATDYARLNDNPKALAILSPAPAAAIAPASKWPILIVVISAFLIICFLLLLLRKRRTNTKYSD